MAEACFIFPGQGSQSSGMGKNIFDKYEHTRELFKTADKVLGYELSDLMFNGSDEELKKTENCQRAIFVCNMAYFEVLKSKINFTLTMGHSVGEYSSLVASGVISYEDALRIVKARSTAMKNAIPIENIVGKTSHMAAVISDDLKTIEDICRECSKNGQIVCVANKNSQEQYVISGNNIAVVNAIEKLKEKGIRKVLYIPVEGPFHSPLMAPAEQKLREALLEVNLKDPTIPYIANYSGRPVYDKNQVLELLVKQVAGTVNWEDSIRQAIILGHNTFIECGAGAIQTNLFKKSHKELIVLDKNKYI